MRTARVITVDRDLYTVRPSGGEDLPARLAGRFRHEAEDATQLPCVGDRVAVEISGERGLIHEVLPRDTVLRRKRPGKDVDFQLIAANIDVAFLVQGCHFDFNAMDNGAYLVDTPGMRELGILDAEDGIAESLPGRGFFVRLKAWRLSEMPRKTAP